MTINNSNNDPSNDDTEQIQNLLDQIPTSAQEKFSAIEFLNQHYQSEAQLTAALPHLRHAVATRIQALDSSISSCINASAVASHDNGSASASASSNRSSSERYSASEVQDLSRHVMSLKQKIAAIQSRASASERTVQEITNKMQKLDLAKGHLQRTITALKRLHMLTSATERLRDVVYVEDGERIDFREAANLLDAVQLLLGHFEAYKGVKKIAELKAEVEKLKSALVQRIGNDFESVGELLEEEDAGGGTKGSTSVIDANSTSMFDKNGVGMESLSEACLVLEALGEAACKRQIDAFCVSQLAPYERAFGKRKSYVENIGELDYIDRRFSWFRRLLKVLDDQFRSVFPSKWPFYYKLTNLFLLQTREHFLIHLKRSETSGSNEKNVTSLIQALQKSRLFEKEMTARLKRDYGVNFDEVKDIDSDDESFECDDRGNSVAANSAQGIKAKYARKKALVSSLPSIDHVNIRGKLGFEKPEAIIGIASSVFDPYMEPYVSLERQNMTEQISKAAKDSTVDSRGELPVFTSSTDLFVYIKNSITRCTVLSKGQTFFMLYEVFKNSLENYAKVMFQKLPSSVSSAASFAFGSSTILSSSVQYRINAGEESNICYVLNTCEYCAETVEALQESISEQINDEYKQKIDMSNVQESFNDYIAKSIQILSSGLESRIEGDLKEMCAASWGSVELVGEESNYVRSMHSAIEPFTETIRKLIPTSYFRSFCDKFVRLLISSYKNAILRLKRISESGTQQLLLDVYNLKTLCLKIPGTGQDSTQNMFTKMVSKEFGHIEILLKLVGTPVELLPDMFKSNWPEASTESIQSVMDLKGMKKPDQQTVLEKMGHKTNSSSNSVTVAAVGDNVWHFSEKVKQGFEVANQTPVSSTSVNENLRQFNENRAAVAAKVNSDLSSMRLKVENFTKSFSKV